MKQHRRKDHEYTDRELVTIALLNPDFSSPSYQWYVDLFLGSNRVKMMCISAVGAYRILLDRAWKEKDCGLPPDDASLGMLSGAGSEWLEIKDQVLCMFFSMDDRLYNRRLLLIRKHQIDNRNQRIAASHKARDNRANELPDDIPGGGSDDTSR